MLRNRIFFSSSLLQNYSVMFCSGILSFPTSDPSQSQKNKRYKKMQSNLNLVTTQPAKDRNMFYFKLKCCLSPAYDILQWQILMSLVFLFQLCGLTLFQAEHMRQWPQSWSQCRSSQQLWRYFTFPSSPGNTAHDAANLPCSGKSLSFQISADYCRMPACLRRQSWNVGFFFIINLFILYP